MRSEPVRARWAVPALIVASTVVVAAVVGSGGGPPGSTAGSSTAMALEAPSDFATFRSDRGFSVAYPSGWQRLRSPDPEVALVVVGEGRDSFLVRVTRLEFSVRHGEVAAMRAVTDPIVTDAEGVTLLAEPEPVELGGLPGYVYVYTFVDPASGTRGAHTHYFAFRDRTMFSMVFQALPVDRFVAAAATFDAIAATFQPLDPTGSDPGG